MKSERPGGPLPMRTAKRLFERIVAPANLRSAWLEARRGKRRRPDVAVFELHAELELDRLQGELSGGSWRAGTYRLQVIREPKARLIAAAPFRDRVVHHALHRVLEPVLARGFLPESYACRRGLGTHRAVLRFQRGLRRHRFVARMDVSRYFLEIDWDVLLGLVGRRIHDEAAIDLVQRVLASGQGLYDDSALLHELGLAGKYAPRPRKGLPIGNLTSQLFANLYLDGLDHFAKRVLRVPEYVRYMDDAVLFGRSERALRDWVGACSEWLAGERRLSLKPGTGQPVSTRATHRFLGHVVGRNERRVAGRTVRKALARLRKSARAGGGAERLAALEQDLRSSLGVLTF